MKFTAVILSLILSVAANALTLKEKKKLEEWKKLVAESTGAKAAKRECGFDIPVSFDEAMVTKFMEHKRSLSSYCTQPVSTLASMCRDATAKGEITKKVKSVKCTLNADEKALTLKFNGTVLEYSVGIGASNQDEKIRIWLENNL